MTLLELVDYMKQGREIEFSYKSHPYFLATNYSTPDHMTEYYIFDDLLKENIVEGKLETILSFEFEGRVCFEKNLDSFCFEYVL